MQVYVDRVRAQFGSWYEFFPRSTGGRDETGRAVHGTFVTAAKELDRVAAMGFDVVYLPPIHPVGTVHRKGRNNSVHAGPGDVGSPWAIGSAEGGHDAIDPELGTFEDFDAFVARANDLGMEVALDFALQCAPDHPWVKEHPEWFTVRPDGTIAYAENPPKKYQDIYPVNFDNDPEGIYNEVAAGRAAVGRARRADLPGGQPAHQAAELLALADLAGQGPVPGRAVPRRGVHPARRGSSGWPGSASPRATPTSPGAPRRPELTEFALMHAERCDEARPNLFVNTPDILHESLQHGGRGMFAIRAALAATMAPTWGVYSGFELYEGEAVKPGSEEYLNSEKYELRPRDFAAAAATGNSLEPYITRLNEIRRAHPALQQLRNIAFHQVNNDQIICYSKTDPATGDTVLVVITLDPWNAQEGTTALDLPALGLNWGDGFTVHDEITGGTWQWGQYNYVRLEPWHHVAHIFRVVR